MKKLKLTALLIAMALSSAAYAADSAADDVKAAAKKLADKGNYSWKSTSDTPGAGGGGGGGRGGAGRMFGPTEGKTDQGVTHLVMARGDNTFEALIKGSKVAFKGQEGWQTADSAGSGDAGGGRGGGRFMARMYENYKTPAEEAQDLATKATGLKKEGDAYVGTLSADAVRDIYTRGRQNAQAPSDTKGSVKFWVKDGVLSKYEVNTQGKMSFQGNEREFNRTTTTEIKDVGTTKLTVPEEATKKLS